MKFDPKKLRYSRHGTPILSVREIEAVADEILETHCADVLKKPGITPVAAIIDRLRERTGLLFAMENLGYKGTAKILGKVSFHRKALYLDLSLNDERKAAFRFTAAHEVGHWVLHRYNYKNWKFNDDQPKVDGLEDDEGTLCRLEQRTPKDWLEFQANVFAASLIMPRGMFVVALIAQQQTMGITKNLGLMNGRAGGRPNSRRVGALAATSRPLPQTRVSGQKLISYLSGFALIFFVLKS